jgi:hypothetical protein
MSKVTVSNKKLLIAATAVVFAVGLLFWQMSKGPELSNTQTPNTQPNCKTIKNQQVCDSSFVGLSEAEATEKSKNDELLYRVVMRDGEGMVITDDFNPNRLNFTIVSGKVSKVEFY